MAHIRHKVSTKVTAYDLKLAGMRYLRFEKGYPLMATEAGKWNADLLAMNESVCIELEIKISVTDLKKDADKIKHHYYTKDFEQNNWHVPTLFYYLYPSGLNTTECESYIHNLNPKYGILLYDSESKKVWVHKKAIALHKQHPTKSMHHVLLMRMSSELTNLYTFKTEITRKFTSFLDESYDVLEGISKEANKQENDDDNGKSMSGRSNENGGSEEAVLSSSAGDINTTPDEVLTSSIFDIADPHGSGIENFSNIAGSYREGEGYPEQEDVQQSP